MSLANRLSVVFPNHSNRGCRTCKWLDNLTAADRAAFDQWLADGHSLQQLYEICAADNPPLDVSLTAFRHHLRHPG